MKKPLTLFCSYSHKDSVYKKKLDAHLKILETQGLLINWSDSQIEPGSNLGEINERLETSDIILLLISANYMNSEICWRTECRRAMERHDERSAIVLPVIVLSCDWKNTPIVKLKALPEDGRPVDEWESPDEAWSSVTQALRRACEEKARRMGNSSSREDSPEGPEFSLPQGGPVPLTRERTLRFMRNSMIYHGHYLSRVVGKPVFFLAVHPSRWEPVYCGLPNNSSKTSAQRIRQKYEEREETLRNGISSQLEPWRIFDKVASEFLDEVQHSTHEIINGAIEILLSDAGLPMGCESDSKRTAFHLEPFHWEHGRCRSRGWFQDALDLWGTSRLSVADFNAMHKNRGEEGFCEVVSDPSDPGRVLALRVHNYMRRRGLLHDRALILLAEFLLFRAQLILAVHVDSSIDVEPSKLSHVFLPLRSNGQWRATACWLSHDGGMSIDGENANYNISPVIQDRMNARCSQIYLEGFSATLIAELGASDYKQKGAIALYRALSVLWWGRIFSFYRKDKIVLCVSASEHDGNHRVVDPKYLPPPSSPRLPSHGEFFNVSRLNDGDSLIVMDLRVIPGRGDMDVAAALSVDVVVIRARLFELDDERHKSEISGQLAERILLAVSPA